MDGGAPTLVVRKRAADDELDGLLGDLASEVLASLTGEGAVEASGAPSTLDSLGHYELGTRALHQREWGPAALHLERSVAENPDFFEAWYHLALARAWSAGSTGDMRAAARRAGELAPTERDRATMRGLFLFLTRRYDEAVTILRAEYEQNPRSRDVLYLLAECVYHSGHYAEGIELFRETLVVAPRFSLAAIHPFRYALAQRDEARALAYRESLSDGSWTSTVEAIDLAMGRLEAAAASGGTPSVRWAALGLLGRDEEALALLQTTLEEGAAERLIEELARAILAGNEASVRQKTRRVFDALESSAVDRREGTLIRLASVLIAAERTDELRTLVALPLAVDDGVASESFLRAKIHSAPLLGEEALPHEDLLWWGLRQERLAIGAEVRGDHEEAIRRWRERLADPGEGGDHMARFALARNLASLGHEDELRVACEKIADPAVYSPQVLIAIDRCKEWSALDDHRAR
ncbi:MAG: CDC27 family protein [Myxococcota bacterium]